VFTFGLFWKFCRMWIRSLWDVGPNRYGLQQITITTYSWVLVTNNNMHHFNNQFPGTVPDLASYPLDSQSPSLISWASSWDRPAGGVAHRVLQVAPNPLTLVSRGSKAKQLNTTMIVINPYVLCHWVGNKRASGLYKHMLCVSLTTLESLLLGKQA